MMLLPRRILIAIACVAACAGRAGAAVVDSTAAANVHIEVDLGVRRFDRLREDGTLAGRRPDAGLARAAIGVSHPLEGEFDARITLVLERVSLLGEGAADSIIAEDGEPRVEEAVLEWRRDRALGLEAGLLYVPVGLLNEAHEGVRYTGSLRNDVESRVIPVVWSAPGVGLRWSGVHGISGRACVVQGLDASRFSAADGIRDGRPRAADAARSHAALALRLDWESSGGVGAGGSLYRGDAWQGAPPPGAALHAPVTLREVHASLRGRGAFARALYVMGAIGDNAALTRALGLQGTSDAIGDRFFGGFVEAGIDVAPAAWPGTRRTLVPFARSELSDTQDGVGPVGSEDPSRHRTTLTVGLQFSPLPGVAVKAERQQRHDEKRTQAGEWNAAVAFAF